MNPTIQNLLEEEMRLRQQISALRRAEPPEDVADHALVGPGGAVMPLSSLFGAQPDLLVLHNMGQGCAYCTLWADGLNGLLPHLEDRTGVVLVSPDDPATQARFAAERGWRFRMISDAEGAFSRALGFRTEHGYQPGVSALRRGDDGRIVRTGYDWFGPGDPYCGLWHLLDLLQGGAGSWQPRFAYWGDAAPDGR